MKLRTVSFVLFAVTLANAQMAAPQPADMLARARAAMGFARLNGKVIHTKWAAAVEQAYQSDRMYPPFFSMMLNGDSWTDPDRGVERVDSQVAFPGSVMPVRSIADGKYKFMLRENAAPVPQPPDDARGLDAWLMLSDWSKAANVRYLGRETYRDYPREVLVRQNGEITENLFLDPKTGYPVMLERQEPHYLWGQQTVRYIYSVWQQFGELFTPTSTFRTTDDEVETSRTIAAFELVDAATAPSMSVPDAPAQPIDKTPIFLRPYPPETIEVSANTKILSNRGYRETVTRVGDEVYVFDATQGEERARQDRDIILKLFPGTRRVYVVVTDLAWPHVSGLRYWVANGATIVTHRAAESFLRKVLDRRWTMHPDSYERSRKSVKVNFVTVDKEMRLAGGKIELQAIDGIGSEVALIAYLPADHFLWASDFVQTLSEPTMYAREVINAVERAHFQPQKVAAEHLPLNTWQNVLAAQQPKRGSDATQ